MEEQAAVIADHLSKSFVHNGAMEQVLGDVSFTLRQGEIVSLLGQSGCGKSTLLNLIGGFIQPDSGVVRVGGREVERPSRDCIMLFQDYGLLPWRSVLANVELGLAALKLSAAQRRERAEHYLALVGLRDKVGMFPGQLSGGMKQRVALARALAIRPALLLMDEPFAALDTFNRYYLQEELLRIQANERVTIVLVTHDIDEAVYLSDRVLIMGANPGRIVRELPVQTTRPRDRGHGEFQHYRKLILEQFRLSGQTTAEEFTI